MKSLKEFILSKGTRKHIARVQDADARKLAKLRAARRAKNPTFVDKFKKGLKKESLEEKLSASDGQQAWIDDFLKSDAPQFKGKSKEEIVKMAVAAFNAAKKNEGSHGPEGMGHPYSDYADKFAKKKIRLSKHIDQDAHAAKLGEDVPANAVAGGGVDMNPTGKPKKFNDGRSKYDVTKMFRRASVK